MPPKRDELVLQTAQALPNFEAGVLSEPLLLFGGHQTHIDPKTG
jgi:hypothetical protein